MGEWPSSKRYEPESVDLENKNSSHAQIIELAGRGNLILEVGTSTGYLTSVLKDRGNSVIGVEIDEEAGKIADQYCDTMIIGDVEEVDLDEHLRPGSIDVAIFGDVLEHLRYPSSVLEKIKKYLKPDGRLVVSVPNVCHGDILLNLLKGDFRYTPVGLLDETHIRFFGFKNIVELLNNSGFSIDEIHTVRFPLGHTELGADLGKMPKELLKFVEALPNSDVYQFVFSATLSQSPRKEPVPEADFGQIFDRSIEGLLKESARPLELEIEEIDSERQAALKLVGDLKAWIRERDGRIEELGEELEKAAERAHSLDLAVSERDGRIEELDEYLRQSENHAQQLENEIAEMRRSIVWQLLMRFHNFAVERALPQGSKQRNFYDLGLKGGRILVNEGPRCLWYSFRSYVKMPKAEMRNRILPSLDDGTFCLTPSEFRPINAKIAVIIHVYYVDIFEEICSYLKNIPIKFTLLISVSREEDKDTVAKQIEHLPFAQNAEIKVVENRGRDIAPMLIDFEQSIRNYDYVCHIHTKKSLRSGGEQIEWRQYLYDMLLGSKERVNAILSVLEADSSIGLIYPEVFDDAPYWGFTWLGNKGIASSILEKMDVRLDPDHYIDFPVGSMFWARREALEPLLDLGLRHEEFPEEHGQTDCTLHHTIERCFVLAAQSRGLKYLVIQNKKGNIFAYRDSRNLHRYLSPPSEVKLRVSLPISDVVSFDIFDTLLIRPFANPDMVFEYLDDKVLKRFGIKNFRKMRKESEYIARKRKYFHQDVTISEIYSVFAEFADISITTAEKLKELEVCTETYLLSRRESVIKLAKEASESSKRVILVSDMYLEKTHIEKILFANNIDFYDEIYISCEIGKRKDRGDLWDYVLKCENIPKNRLLHVGDNEQSDVHVLAERQFMHPVHIMKPSVLFRQSLFGELLWEVLKPNERWEDNLLYGMVANLFCSDPNPKDFFESKEPMSDPFKLGYTICGPIVFNFLSWLIRVSKEDDIKELKFIAREGFLLNQAFEIIKNHPNIIKSEIILPNGSYLLCSRRAAIFAALIDEADIYRLLERHFQGTLRAFFEKRINVSDMGAIENRLGKDVLDQIVSLPENHNQIFTNIIKVFDILTNQAELERETFLQYCTEQGISSSGKIGIVDIGYSGSIQKALKSLLGYPLAGYYFVTDKMASELKSSGSICRAYFGEFVDPLKSDIPIQRYSLLMEAILTAPAGQLIYFRHGIENVEPVFKKPGLSQKEFSTIKIIHDGVLKFVTDMLDSFGTAALDIEFSKDRIQCCYALVVNGMICIGKMKKFLSVEDEFCGNSEIPVLDQYAKMYDIDSP